MLRQPSNHTRLTSRGAMKATLVAAEGRAVSSVVPPLAVGCGRQAVSFNRSCMSRPAPDHAKPSTFFIRAVMSANSFSPPPPTSLVAQPS